MIISIAIVKTVISVAAVGMSVVHAQLPPGNEMIQSGFKTQNVESFKHSQQLQSLGVNDIDGAKPPRLSRGEFPERAQDPYFRAAGKPDIFSPNDLLFKVSLELLPSLIQQGADARYHHPVDGDTVLHRLAALTNQNPRQIQEIMEFFVSQGADINARNRYYETPLYVAAKNNNKEAAEFLLARGADPSIPTAYRQTALDLTKSFRHPLHQLFHNSFFGRLGGQFASMGGMFGGRR